MTPLPHPGGLFSYHCGQPMRVYCMCQALGRTLAREAARAWLRDLAKGLPAWSRLAERGEHG
jgi:hypothetical protein